MFLWSFIRKNQLNLSNQKKKHKLNAYVKRFKLQSPQDAVIYS